MMWFRKSPKPFLFLFIGFCLLAIIFLINIVYWYMSTYRTQDLINTIQNAEVVGVEQQVPEKKPAQAAAPKPVLPPYVDVSFTDLKKRNPDIISWLKFDAVNISIPITQTTNNEYYLEHDVDRQNSKLGWVFADVRSNMEHLGFNTVFYGHNAANKQMFGSLKDILTVTPETRKTKEVLQLTTPHSQMVFQVVSVYVTDYTDWKYVNQVFTGPDAKKAFIDRMREKNSMKVFDRTDLSTQDKFLTFSTCYGPAGTSDRLVIHARLVAERSVPS